jgi:hypothetical protein
MNNGEIEAGPTGVENASPTETDLRVVPSMNGAKSDNNLATVGTFAADLPNADLSGAVGQPVIEDKQSEAMKVPVVQSSYGDSVDDSPSLDYSGSLDECGGSDFKGAGELFSRSQLKCCERMKFWLDCCLPGQLFCM